MRFYVSKTNNVLNGKPLDTESLTEYVCLNPNYKSVSLSREVSVLMDSGAFQDRTKRVSFEQALQRQLDLEKKVNVVSERIVAYDMIGDTDETIRSNQFLASKRTELEPRQLVFMLQGEDSSGCVRCFDALEPLLTIWDCVGIGGVALAGRRKDHRAKLLETFEYIAPRLIAKGIADVHVFGVCSMKVLDALIAINQKYGNHLNLSCDSSAAEIRSVMGTVFDTVTRKWTKTYPRSEKMTGYHPCDLTRQNISALVEVIGNM